MITDHERVLRLAARVLVSQGHDEPIAELAEAVRRELRIGRARAFGLDWLAALVGGSLDETTREPLLRLAGEGLGAVVAMVEDARGAWTWTLEEVSWRVSLLTREAHEGSEDLAAWIRVYEGPNAATEIGGAS